MSEISKEWLDEKFKGIDALFSDNKSDHEKILDQTIKINGSVKNLQLWRARILGAISVLTVLIIPILLMLIRKWV